MSVLFYICLLESGSDFTKARKVYLVSERRKELASRYEAMYRRVADLLGAARTYCQGLELRDAAKR